MICILTSPASCCPRQEKKKKKADEINDQENQNEGKENMRFYLAAQNRQLHDKATSCMEWKEHFLV